jgi:syntaxin 1B/2/3
MPSYSGDGANHFGILEECRKIDRELDQLDGQLNELNSVFGQTLARPDMPSGEINNLSSQIITRYITLVSGVKNIKLQPESGNERNASQVGNVDRRLRRTYHRYQVLEADFRRESKEASKHQFRITHPDATDAEVEDAVADTDTPVFQQVVRLFCRHLFFNASVC